MPDPFSHSNADSGRLSHLITPMTRTSDGKRIDVWRVAIAGRGLVDFEIRMHLDRSAPRFEAITLDPDLRNFVAARSSDISELQRLLERAVEDFAESRYGEEWPAAIALECGVHETRLGRYGGSAPAHLIDVKLQTQFVRAEPVRAGRNSPFREILSGERRMTILERSRETEVSGLMSGDRSGISVQARASMERETPVSRAILPDDPALRQDLRLMNETLRQFGIMLADRLSPAGLEAAALAAPVPSGSPRRLPSPEDMAALMEAAARVARASADADLLTDRGAEPGTGIGHRQGPHQTDERIEDDRIRDRDRRDRAHAVPPGNPCGA